jgi:hypothetical protein
VISYTPHGVGGRRIITESKELTEKYEKDGLLTVPLFL